MGKGFNPSLEVYPLKYFYAEFLVSQWKEGNRLERVNDEVPAVNPVTPELELMFYCLSQQANYGTCSEPRPSYWTTSTEDLEKWKKWNELGDMNKFEAMRLFVKALEFHDKHWGLRVDKGDVAESGESEEEPEVEVMEPRPQVEEKDYPKEDGVSVEIEAASEPASESEQPLPPISPAPTMSPNIYDNWTPLPLAQAARYGCGVCEGEMSGEEVCLLSGGIGKRGSLLSDTVILKKKDLTVLDVPVSSPPVPRAFHAAALLGSSLLIYGGRESDKTSGEVYILDLNERRWLRGRVTGTPPPAAEGFASSVILDPLKDSAQIVVTGGCDTRGQYVAVPHILEVDRDSNDRWQLHWKAPKISETPLPPPRRGHSQVTWNGRIIIFGGQTLDGSYCNDTWILDPNTGMWTCVSKEMQPAPRAGHSMCRISDRFAAVTGGGDGTKALHDLWILNLETFEWTQISTTGPICEDHVLFANGNTLIVWGGWDGAKDKVLKSVYSFDLAEFVKPKEPEEEMPYNILLERCKRAEAERDALKVETESLREQLRKTGSKWFGWI